MFYGAVCRCRLQASAVLSCLSCLVEIKTLGDLLSDPGAGCIPKRHKGETVQCRVVVDLLTAPAVKRRQPELEL